MSNFNKVILVGRVTRDPEVKTFASGAKVSKFGFAVNEKRKSKDTGQWEDVPMFFDVDAFNGGPNPKLADVIESYVKKGTALLIEGKLKQETWAAPDGKKNVKVSILAEKIEFMQGEKRQERKQESAPTNPEDVPW